VTGDGPTGKRAVGAGAVGVAAAGAGGTGAGVRRWPRPPEIVVLGSASRDVVDDDPRGWRLGGGVTYSALTAARLGLRTAAVIGVDAEAATARELDDVRAAGAELLLAPLPEGPVFRNVETPGGRIQTAILAGVSLPVAPLPDSWRRARAWLFAPVAGEIADAWAAAVPDDVLVAVAWQGFLRRLVSGERVTRRAPAPSRLFARADIVAVSHHDLDPETPLSTLYPLLQPGARLLVTQGASGGFLVTLGPDGLPAEEVRYRPSRADAEVDPTGAGDTFFAALVSTAVRRPIAGRSHGRVDLPFAAAAGSLAVEGPGLEPVPDRGAVLVRMARDRVRRLVYPTAADRIGSRDGD
jgi:sugar/nucleoside kinase (ribokinase family)